MINGAVNVTVKSSSFQHQHYYSQLRHEGLDYFLNIPKSSTKAEDSNTALLISQRVDYTSASCFVCLCNNAQFKIWFTVFYYPRPQFSSFSSISESPFKSFYLLLFQFYLKENSPKCRNIFSGFCESCFEYHITKVFIIITHTSPI